MIRFVTKEDSRFFLSSLYFSPVLDAKIYTLYKMYGFAYKDVSFWSQTDSGRNITAVISLYGGHLNISARRGCDTDELREFLGFIGGYSSVSLPGYAEGALPRDKSDTSRFSIRQARPMYRKSGAFTANGFADTDVNLSDIYQLLCAADVDFRARTDFESWYVHTSLLVRRGLGFCAGIYRDGILVSTGGVYAASEKHALIGGVATMPEHRGRGYAGEIVARLVGRSLELGLVPVLLAGNVELANWYGSMGFAEETEYTILEAEI